MQLFSESIIEAVLLTLLTILFTECATPSLATNTSDTEHIIIIAFDGWGASSFQDADMPFLKSKVQESAWTLHKRSILPSSSACNWATMFKGVGPEAHGYIAWDTKKPVFDAQMD